MPLEHLDVLVVGAGLSGIGAACHLQKECPGRRFAILEGRERLGGTWDLFRYPGIRSDSDMFTLGYDFKPWTEAKAIADGPSILRYLQATAREHGVEAHIRTQHRVVAAAWSSETARWTVDVAVGPTAEVRRMTCDFLFLCSGYYRYDHGHDPHFEGRERFQGRIAHPQHWPEDLDYTGQRVVVVGSGATAVTLVPSLAQTAAHVTMLQRSPTYLVNRPSVDKVANWLRRHLGARLAYDVARWWRIGFGLWFYKLSRREPEKVKRLLLKGVAKDLGSQAQVDAHFTPRYQPWDQRLCLVPDGDMFTAIRAGRASVVTDQIAHFDETGIQLQSGQHLDADLIVTATGLELQNLGGMALTVDGRAVVPSQTFNYKGMMFSDVPNLAATFGYTNASWTLKSDLVARYVCRLLNHMQAKGYTSCTPRNTDPTLQPEPWVDLSSGYFQRAMQDLPKQGSKRPWKLHQNYPKDLMALRYGKLEDGVMGFGR